MRLDVSAAFTGTEIVPGDVEVADGVVTARRPLAARQRARRPRLRRPAGQRLGRRRPAHRRPGRPRAPLRRARRGGHHELAPHADQRAGGGARARLQGPWPRACLGVHLEGPFLSPEKGGAHPPEYLRAPDLGELRRLLDAGPVDARHARARAARRARADRRADRSAASSSRAGHTTASSLPPGIRAVTAPPQRDGAGDVRAALARADIAIQVIVDLLHVPGDTVRADYERSRGRFSLVSDAVGDSLGGRPVEAQRRRGQRRPRAAGRQQADDGRGGAQPARARRPARRGARRRDEHPRARSPAAPTSAA